MTEDLKPSSEGTAVLCLPPTLKAKCRYRSDEASIYLEAVHGLTVAKATLEKLRSVGGGPRFQKFNRSALYHRDDLDAWAQEKLSPPLTSTSDTGAAHA